MTSAHIIAAVVGIGLSLTIFLLVRRDQMSPNVAARWFLVSLVVLLVGISPGTVDYIGTRLNIGYPPILPVICAISVALIKILLMDIERQKMQVKLDRIAQKLVILEAAMEGDTKAKTSHSKHSQARQLSQKTDTK